MHSGEENQAEHLVRKPREEKQARQVVLSCLLPWARVGNCLSHGDLTEKFKTSLTLKVISHFLWILESVLICVKIVIEIYTVDRRVYLGLLKFDKF